MQSIKITLQLAPVTKKNSQQIITVGNRKMIIPSKKYQQYEKDCGWALKRYSQHIETPVEVTCIYYMPTKRRVDLTNLLEATDDILVKYGVLADDNSTIIKSHDGSRVRLDRDNPRTEVTITDFEEEEN